MMHPDSGESEHLPLGFRVHGPSLDHAVGDAAAMAVNGTMASDRCGRGVARGHHGELLQGVFRNDDGRLCRGLTSLPCHELFAEAVIELSEDSQGLTVQPQWKTKALRGAAAAMEAIGIGYLGGRLSVRNNIPVGCGFGSSTADVTASIRAVLDASGKCLTAAEIARLAVAVEVAADPLMFTETLLFAQREGDVIERFSSAGKKVAVLGIALPVDTVDTIAFPMARYDGHELRQFEELRSTLRQAVGTGDVAGLGHVATQSARINQRFLPVPGFDALLTMVSGAGADGIQVAHSGNVGAFLFDPDDPNLADRLDRVRHGLRGLEMGPLRFYEEQL